MYRSRSLGHVNQIFFFFHSTIWVDVFKKKKICQWILCQLIVFLRFFIVDFGNRMLFVLLSLLMIGDKHILKSTPKLSLWMDPFLSVTITNWHNSSENTERVSVLHEVCDSCWTVFSNVYKTSLWRPYFSWKSESKKERLQQHAKQKWNVNKRKKIVGCVCHLNMTGVLNG